MDPARMVQEVAGIVRDLAVTIGELKRAVRVKPELLQGSVAAVALGPPLRVSVNLPGGIVTGIRCFEMYQAPAVGDEVWLIDQRNGGLMVLGRLQP